MRVLTIKQPHASLIMHGYKKIETRGWIPKNPKLIEQIKEEGLLIHAGAGKDKAEIELFNNWKHSHLHNSNFRGIAFNDLPFGAIIGKVNLEGFIKSEITHDKNNDGVKIHFTHPVI